MGEYGITSNWWPVDHIKFRKNNKSTRRFVFGYNNSLVKSKLPKSVEPANWLQKVSVVAVVSLISASLVIAITVPLTIGKAPQPADVNIVIEVRDVGGSYMPEMAILSNSDFQNYAKDVCLTLIPVLSSPETLGANYVPNTCQVLELRNGSIISRIQSTFRIDDQAKTSVISIQNKLYETLTTLVANNTLTKTIDPKSFFTYTKTAQNPCADMSATKQCEQICVPNSGDVTYQCACFNGYFLNGPVCQGQDVCGLKLDNCDKITTTCVNDKYNTFKCLCNAGFRPIDGLTNICADINECDPSLPSACNQYTSVCNNKVGSYQCSCLPGYKQDPNLANNCVDIDECALQVDHCDYTTTNCINTAGSYNCICKSGFQGITGYYCLDTDECVLQQSCNLNTSTCVNTFGSYWCDCFRPYYKRGADMITCIDVNECADQSDYCDVYSQNCYNTNGNYSCICKTGYQLNGTKCVDVDECLNTTLACPSGSPCSNCVSRNCVNTLGSYYCNCLPGFKLDTFNGQETCKDIDECDTMSSICDVAVSYCNNTVSSYNCVCKYPAINNDRLKFPSAANGCLSGEYGLTIGITGPQSAAPISLPYSVSFDSVSLNYGFNLNLLPVTKIPLPVFNKSTYWIHLSLASTSAYTHSLIYLNSDPLYQIMINNFNNKFDTASISSTLVGNSSFDVSVQIASGQPTNQDIYGTSITIFSIDGLFKETSIVYLPVVGEEENAIPPNYHIFVSLTIGNNLNTTFVAQLLVNDELVTEIHYERSDGDQVEFITAACFIPSSVAPKSKVRIVSGSTDLMGAFFLPYAPLDPRFTSVLWCVYLTTPVASNGNFPKAVIFDEISLAGQRGLLLPNSSIQVPVTGVYYIDLTVLTVANQALAVWVSVNGIGKFGIKRDAGLNYSVTRNKASLVKLNKGNIVSVMMTGQLYGSYSRVTSFSGFLLFAH